MYILAEVNFLIQLHRKNQVHRTRILVSTNLFASLFQAYPLLSSCRVTEALVSRKRSRLVYKTFILNASNCETATAQSSFLYIYICVRVCVCMCIYIIYIPRNEKRLSYRHAVLFHDRFYNTPTIFLVSGISLAILSQPHAPAANGGFQGIFPGEDQPLIIANHRVLT